MAHNLHPDEGQLKFIERFGMLLEHVAQPPMLGRVLGWLLLCDPPQQSMGQLTEVLRASKGSISTSMQTLTRLGWVQRVRLSGQRRAYYRIPEGVWAHMLKERLAFTVVFRQLADEGLDLLKDAPLPRKRRLKEMHEVFSFFERELPAMIEHWEQRRGRRP